MANYAAPISLALAMIFSVTGQFFLKNGAVKVSLSNFMQTVFFNIPLILGLIFFVFSTGAYIVALRKLPLSIAYPTTAISYVLITVISYYFLGETVSKMQILGMSLICVGVAILWRGAA